MKKLFPLLLFIPLFISCSSDDGEGSNKNDPYLYEISVKEYTYKFGEASLVGDVYEIFKFNSGGKLLNKETNYYNSGINSRINKKYEYTYDEKGRISSKSDYTLSLLDYKYIYSYNSIDSVSMIKVYNGDGKLYETQTYEYSVSNKLSKAIIISNWLSNDFGYIHNYTYIGSNVIDTTYQAKDSSLFGVTLDEYDSHGNLTGNTWTNGSTGKKTKQKSISYVYDSNGMITKTTTSGMIPENLTYNDYTYNSDGNIKKIHVSYSYKTDESDLMYEYKYK